MDDSPSNLVHEPDSELNDNHFDSDNESGIKMDDSFNDSDYVPDSEVNESYNDSDVALDSEVELLSDDPSDIITPVDAINKHLHLNPDDKSKNSCSKNTTKLEEDANVQRISNSKKT